VHLVGDTIVDSYTQTTMIGGQTKTPTMSVLYEGRKDYVGGAGIVAKHMRAAGANVTFSTVLGEDQLKDYVLDDLRAAGVECNVIIDPTRPTTNKNAFVAGGYRLLKVDTLDNSSINDQILHQFTHSIDSVQCDAVVFSDFRHGIFNKRTIPTLVDAIPSQTYTAADSQVASRWGNITEFKGFDLITPNEREARFALADQDSGVKPLAFDLFNEAKCKLLVLKLGDRGVLTCRSDRDVEVDPVFSVDSFVDNVVDAVGAGDALLSYAVLSMLATKNEVIATLLGSMAAACLCELEGNMPITPIEVKAKIDAVERQANYG
jgi:rfaE bifunctional protein kinase chain/domain